jgi:hypothetical protein
MSTSVCGASASDVFKYKLDMLKSLEHQYRLDRPRLRFLVGVLGGLAAIEAELRRQQMGDAAEVVDRVWRDTAKQAFRTWRERTSIVTVT